MKAILVLPTCYAASYGTNDELTIWETAREALFVLALARDIPGAHCAQPQRHHARRGRRCEPDARAPARGCVPRSEPADDASGARRRGRPRAVSVARYPRISRRDPPAAAASALFAARPRPRAGARADRRLRLSSAGGAAGARLSRARAQA